MTFRIAVLRPDPAARVTAAAIEARGQQTIRLPLFAVRPLDWQPPSPQAFDALVLTSANTLRHGGAALGAYHGLPTYAVGEATAQAARRHGFDVAFTGTRGATDLLAEIGRRGVARALHIAGRDRQIEAGGPIGAVIAVYASEALPVDSAALTGLTGNVALLHSERAARRLRELIDGAGLDRIGVALAAISPAVARAAGDGWRALAVAERPVDPALIDAAIALADPCPDRCPD